ncbi:MAG: multicopper oxidase domain-containing protein [Gaiellales bacterium]
MSAPQQQRTAKREHAFRWHAFGPFAVSALIVSIAAIFIAISAAQDDVEAGTNPMAAKMKGERVVATPSERLNALPDATKKNTDLVMKKFDPVTEPVKAGPKTFKLVTTERNVDVGGKLYKLWTFNDLIPGPTMRVVVGDRVTIKIKNEGKSTYVHSIDYHSSRLSGGGGYVQVAPGEEGEFSFVAEYPGVFMYHCGTPPILHHIGMGMYGMMIVQPKEGFGKPMKEYAFTQSELYANMGDMEAQLPAQTTFNGLPKQYLDEPIKLDADEEIRIFFLNAGPSHISSFHVVGTIMDTAFADGNPANQTIGRQTIVLGASSSVVAEMKLVGEGTFPFVTHQFGHGEMGAVGAFVTGDGDPVGDGTEKMEH